MPVGRAEVVINDGESDVGDARKHRLHAVEPGEPPAHGHDQPAQEPGVGKRDALRGYGPVALVQCVLFGVGGLVGEVELEDMEPDPEDDVGEPEDVINRCRGDGQRGLYIMVQR